MEMPCHQRHARSAPSPIPRYPVSSRGATCSVTMPWSYAIRSRTVVVNTLTSCSPHPASRARAPQSSARYWIVRALSSDSSCAASVSAWCVLSSTRRHQSRSSITIRVASRIPTSLCPGRVGSVDEDSRRYPEVVGKLLDVCERERALAAEHLGDERFASQDRDEIDLPQIVRLHEKAQCIMSPLNAFLL